MATYKMIQDIEAEDHLIGNLSFRQFIYALIAAACFGLSFVFITKGPGFLALFTLPPGLFCGFFAFPFGRDQPTEVWALAKIRFYFKPRKRLWDQSGVKELVTITVPKHIERILTNGLSQNEVESRLKALANTIDSRGWAVKNVNVNMYDQSSDPTTASSDRLVGMSSLPQVVPDYTIQASDDILDETSNPIAQQFDSMINASAQAHRQNLINQMNSTPAGIPLPPAPAQSNTQPQGQAGPPADYWFLNQPAQPSAPLPIDQTMFASSSVVQPGMGSAPLPDQTVPVDEAALSAQLHANSNQHPAPYGHLRTLQPMGSQPVAVVPQPVQPIQQPYVTRTAPQPVAPVIPKEPAVTAKSDAAILNLANNNDLNVATLAREAQKAKQADATPEGEVVISLH